MSECPLCALVAAGADTLVFEDDHSVAFLHPAPATRGHLLVVPRRHAEDLFTIAPTELAHTVRVAQQLALRLAERVSAEGINLLNACRPAAWQTVFPFHLHGVPRYTDDGLRPPWEPQAGEPAALAALAAQLR